MFRRFSLYKNYLFRSPQLWYNGQKFLSCLLNCSNRFIDIIEPYINKLLTPKTVSIKLKTKNGINFVNSIWNKQFLYFCYMEQPYACSHLCRKSDEESNIRTLSVDLYTLFSILWYTYFFTFPRACRATGTYMYSNTVAQIRLSWKTVWRGHIKSVLSWQ